MPNLHALPASCICLEPRPLPSTDVTRLPRYYGPLRHPKSPESSLASFRLVIPDHAKGLPVLRALSLCTCCRHYPGTATDGPALLTHSVVSAFPGMAARSACASSVSRFAQRSLTLRPAHSRCHRILWPAIRRLQPFRYLYSCSGCFRQEHFAGWGFHPLESAAFARRTPSRDVRLFLQAAR